MITEERIVKIVHKELGVMYKKNRYTYDESKSFEDHSKDETFFCKEFVAVSTEKEYLNQNNGK